MSATTFNARHFERITFERSKGPSEKRRLQKRLEERRRKKGLPPLPVKPAPAAPKKPVSFFDYPTRTRDERHANAAKHRKTRINRKLRERQRAAARSGLPELDRQSKWRSRGAAQAQPPAMATTEGCPRKCVVESGTAAEIIEVSSDARQKTPDATYTKDAPPWQ